MRLNKYKSTIKPIIRPSNRVENISESLRNNGLYTVCEQGACPNRYYCWNMNNVTILLMGRYCTRNCLYCNINSGIPQKLDKSEIERLAIFVKEIRPKKIILTSVTRDDVEYGGALHFKNTILRLRQICSNIKIEVVIPDFNGIKNNIDLISDLDVDIIAHNIETVQSLYPILKPKCNFDVSMDILSYLANQNSRKIKTGIMVGLGENISELEQLIKKISEVNINVLTVGQYFSPSSKHYPVQKIYSPEEFDYIEQIIVESGISEYGCEPLMRSSYLPVMDGFSVRNKPFKTQLS